MNTEGSERTAVDSGARAGVGQAAKPPDRDGAGAGFEGPRTVTTGGKTGANSGTQSPTHAPKDIDPATGERFDARFISARHGYKITRHLTSNAAASASTALIDTLAFTLVPPDGGSMRWVVEQMQQFLTIDQLQQRNGCFGFKQSAQFGGGAGLVAWGGASQRSRVYFSLQGIGCSMIKDWPGLSTWLRDHQATLKRVDVAYDDFKGQTASVAWAIDQYRSEGFNAGGRKPKHQVFGDWLSGEGSTKGRTLGIGNRASGKYCRIYEKGKQLGDAFSPWTRVEVEWHNKDRLLPYELLTEPGKYLAGAYPCMAFLSVEQLRIKTIANSATISYEAAVDHARQQTGKLVNLMVRVHGGDQGAVIQELWRNGIPARIDPYSFVLAPSPELLDRGAPGGFAATGAVE